VLAIGRGNSSIRKKPLEIPGAAKIVANLQWRADRPDYAICPHRGMHTERHIEFSARELFLQSRSLTLAFGFVVNDKLNVRNVTEQGSFGFADDPGDWCFGPRILN
jgi:hypothetical protein